MMAPDPRAQSNGASSFCEATREGRAQAAQPPPSGRAALAEMARALLDQRRARHGFLPRSLFHEPAWEILLALYIAHHAGEPLNVKQVVALVDAPATTSQRWIDQLVHMRLLTRAEAAADRRRLEIALSEQAVQALEGYLRSLPPSLV